MLFVFVGVVKAEEWPYLENLRIRNALNDIQYDKEKNDYLVTIAAEDTKLDLDYTVDEEYEVVIDGNNNLKTRSKVTIEVIDGDNTNIYTLTINKKEVEKEEKKETKKEEDKANNNWIFILLGIVLVVIIVGGVIYIKKNNK